jgi:nucleoside-diphosphate-sugar epimerase
MKLLVTGATGFIGSRLVVMARDAGFEVLATGAINNPTEDDRCQALARNGVDVVVGSLLDDGLVTRLVGDCDAIIHLAAAQHEAHMGDDHFERVNVEGVRGLLQAAAEAGVRRFVYGGTIGVYGGVASTPQDESSPLQPDNVYTRTKLQAEQLVRASGDRLEPTIMRIAETYGPGDVRLLKLFRAIKRGRFLMIGPGRNRHALVHRDDVARGLLLGATHPDAAGQTFVLAGGDDLTTRAMVDAVAAAIGRRVPRFSLPFWPFLLAATVGERVLKPLGIKAPLHRRSLDFFEKSFTFSIDKIAGSLGYTPRCTFAASAAEARQSYEQQGLL